MKAGDRSAPQFDSTAVGLIRNQYWQILMLSSGIQMAGPKLAPQTFANALWTTKFPNPLTPIYEGKVGFAGKSLQMTTDAAEFWVSNTASGPYSDKQAGTGVVCYVNHGARHDNGHMPRGGDDVFFKGTCDSGTG